MTAILYPVARTAEAALHAPLGYATRAREAEIMAAAAVSFSSETVGPAFATREAALVAYNVDEGLGASAGRSAARLDEAHGVRLAPITSSTGKPAPALQPTYSGGRRWPIPEVEPLILWRLSISFWRVGGAPVAEPMEAARRLRRDGGARHLSAPVLNALARQPLRALQPQQPLDIGLFEVRPPEAPDTLIPDE